MIYLAFAQNKSAAETQDWMIHFGPLRDYLKPMAFLEVNFVLILLAWGRDYPGWESVAIGRGRVPL